MPCAGLHWGSFGALGLVKLWGLIVSKILITINPICDFCEAECADRCYGTLRHSTPNVHAVTIHMSHTYYEGHTNEDLLLVEIMFGDIS
jgi:hypothetical protein